MGLENKIRNEAEEAKGKAKKWVGDRTDNPRLADEGRADQTESQVKQAGEHVKDAVSDVKDAVTD